MIDMVVFKQFQDAITHARILNHLGVDAGSRPPTSGCWLVTKPCKRPPASASSTRRWRSARRRLSSPSVDMLIRRCAGRGGWPTLTFEVLAASEFVGREISAGRLVLVPGDAGRKVTYHDACKVARHGGVIDEPRMALQALGVDFRESAPTAELNWCCGGGAGTFLINRAEPLRHKAWQIKRAQIDATGADTVVLSCASCRLNFMAGAEVDQSPLRIESLIELVAVQLPPEAGSTRGTPPLPDV